ncbi:MAG TPA: glycosyltransferase family 39 protein [Roseiflexaceae bacterium]|nr:glycosyltransferase family 39 protein [Roseiflexaceae bacterium]
MSQPQFSLRGALRPHIRPIPAALPPIWTAAALLLALTMALVLAGAAFARPGLRIAIGSDPDTRVLYGFHQLECNGSDCFRWTEPYAALFLYGFEGRPALVELRMSAARDTVAAPADLRLSQNEQPLGSLAVAPEWRRYRILTPTNPTGATEIILESTLYQPPTENRELGQPVSHIAAEPLAPLRALDGWRRLLFLLTLPLLGLLALWRLGLGHWSALGLALPLVGLAGWAAARPVESGYVLPTVLWPWWPLLPLLALTAAPAIWSRLRVALDQRDARWTGWGGAALALAAALALRLGLDPVLGLPLLLTGALLVCTALPAEAAAPDRPIPARLEALLLAGLTGLALVLRLYNLDGQPAGIWRDEARHALLALRIWSDPGFRPIYVVEGADLPALLFYLMAPVVGTLGPHLWSARLVSAVLGALTPLALWWAARPLLGQRGALLGAALLAWASWSLSMSRWAFPATLDQVLVLTAAGFLWRGLAPAANGGGQPPAVNLRLMAAGLCAGLATYAYHTGRMAPLLLAALAALRLGWSPAAWRRAAPGLALAALVGLITVGPLLWFIGQDFAGYNRRTGRVSIVANNNRAPLDTLANNSAAYLLMWHVQGEHNGRHHAPEVPMVDPLAGTLLALGVALAVARREPTPRVLLVWLLVGLLPGLLSTDAPHAMRGLGALAPACMLAAAALDRLLASASRSPSPQPSAPRSYATAGLALALALSLGFNGWLYFASMARNPAVYSEFDPATTAMGRIGRIPFDTADPALRAVRVFVAKESAASDEMQFLDRGVVVGTFDGARLSGPPGPDALVLLPKEAPPDWAAAVLAALGPDATEIAEIPREPDGVTPLFRAFAVGRGALLLP